MIGWLDNRQFFTLAFLVAVLFFFKYKNHYIAIYFWKKKFIHIIDSFIYIIVFWLSRYLGYYPLVDFFFLLSRSANEREMGIFSMITNYYHWCYHQLFLLHYNCFSIIIAVYSKVWGRLVCSCSEYFQYWVRFYGDYAIDLRLKLVYWFLVYTGSIWYISDK